MEKRNSVLGIIVIALFTAIIIVFSQIAIPMPSGVPMTLQPFGLALCGYIIGAKKGVAATAAYIALGAVGLPVFNGFRGGIGVLLGVTGGFIWGFIFLSFLCGISKKFNKIWISIPMGLAGLFICHLMGSVQYSVLSSIGICESILLVSLPYLVKDIVFVAIAFSVSIIVQKSLAKAKINI